jgi:hypothetical protein
LKWCDKFNEWIDKYELLEIKLAGRNFTWSNNQENVVRSYIDRIFCYTDFDAHFPLTRNPSDHVPLLWEAGHDNRKKEFRFKFEKRWLQHEELGEVVESIWKSPIEGKREFRKKSKLRITN